MREDFKQCVGRTGQGGGASKTQQAVTLVGGCGKSGNEDFTKARESLVMLTPKGSELPCPGAGHLWDADSSSFEQWTLASAQKSTCTYTLPAVKILYELEINRHVR